MPAARNTPTGDTAKRGSRSRRVDNTPDDAAPPSAKTGNAGKGAEPTEPTGPPPEVAPADPDEKPAAHVIEALCRVMRDMPPIAKDRKAHASQGGYAYRGIEDITPHTQVLFARHRVLMVPRVTKWETRPITVAGNPWMDVIEEVVYDVYGPGGPTDKITVGPILAIGRDNSDKGGNKCLTQAEKYALIQLFQIADREADVDGTTAVATSVEGHHRAQGATVDDTPAHLKRIDGAEVDRLVNYVKALPPEVRTLVREQWTHVDPMDDEPFLPVDDQGRPHFGLLTVHQVGVLESMVTRLERAHKANSAAPSAAQRPAPAPPPETPPAADTGQQTDEQAPTSWNEIIDGVRQLTEEQLRDELDTRELLEEGMDPVRMRATLVNAIGAKAGLRLSNIPSDAANRPAEPDPADVPFTEEGGESTNDPEG